MELCPRANLLIESQPTLSLPRQYSTDYEGLGRPFSELLQHAKAVYLSSALHSLVSADAEYSYPFVRHVLPRRFADGFVRDDHHTVAE
jgi:hypothetical protein